MGWDRGVFQCSVEKRGSRNRGPHNWVLWVLSNSQTIALGVTRLPYFKTHSKLLAQELQFCYRMNTDIGFWGTIICFARTISVTTKISMVYTATFKLQDCANCAWIFLGCPINCLASLVDRGANLMEQRIGTDGHRSMSQWWQHSCIFFPTGHQNIRRKHHTQVCTKDSLMASFERLPCLVGRTGMIAGVGQVE